MLRGLLRVTIKTFLWLLVVILAIVLLWFVANRIFDETPDPQRDAFLVSSADQIPDERNAAVGILGLTAPPGSDFVQHGSRVKALYTTGAPSEQIQDMLQGQNALALTVTSDQVTCWLDPDHPAFAKSKGCLPFAQAPNVLQANKEVLDRYKSLYQMGGYSSQGISHTRPLFVLLRLSAAEIHLALRDRQYEAAYQAWKDQLSFVKRNLRGPDTWVGKAVELVAFGMTFELIENLLQADPQIAVRHRDELLALFQPEGMAAFNPEGIVRAEYSLLRQALEHPPAKSAQWPLDRLEWLAFHLGQRNRILNRYYAFARDYAQMLRLPWNQVEAEATRLREKHVLASDLDIVHDPFGSMFLARYMESQLKAREMLRQMHIIDGKLRLATLLIRLVDNGVGDKDISGFLSSAGPAFHDPFSGNPMGWNAKERRIYFPDPEYKCATYASLRVPSPRHDAKAVPPAAQSDSC
jgi:hypothetical protein